MKLISYEWFDDGILGLPRIKCDCEEVFELSSVDTESDTTDIIECPSCHLKRKLISKVEFVFEEI